MFVTAVVGQLYHFFVTVNSGAKKGRIAAAGGLIVNSTGSLSQLRTKLPESSSRPLPA